MPTAPNNITAAPELWNDGAHFFREMCTDMQGRMILENMSAKDIADVTKVLIRVKRRVYPDGA